MSNDIEKAKQPIGFAVSDAFYRGVADVLEQARGKAYRAVNAAVAHAYREIGRRIIAPYRAYTTTMHETRGRDAKTVF